MYHVSERKLWLTRTYVKFSAGMVFAGIPMPPDLQTELAQAEFDQFEKFVNKSSGNITD